MKNDPYIVAAFIKAKEQEKWAADGTNPIVTISRQRGALGEAIAFRTAEILTDMSHGKYPWVVVDKNIAERVIEDHHLPQRIRSFFSEEQKLSIEQHVEGILGVSTSGSTMIEKMTRTMVHLARIGHVILVGRASHLITLNFPRAAHIRIFGSFKRRVERVAEGKQCSLHEAAAEVRAADERRRQFVATYFHSDIDDPSHYDLLFNTDRVSLEESARLIAHLVSAPDFREREARKLSDLRHLVLGG
ncbi:MAG: cytidylate kinase-like family protein [Methylacidiphilales bacterium]|nr:cytidylate kinase-like family protein [Candidatus Methylacidiphilales bacterium]